MERIAPEAIRAFDIRGVAGESITPAGSWNLGLSFAAMARARGASRIGVGRDGRSSSPALESALVGGLAAGGLAITRLGLLPTPALTFAVRSLGLDGAVMVTASHNPPAENGFKLMLGGERICGAALRRLVGSRARRAPDGSVTEADVVEAYVEALVEAADDAAPLAIAWDSGSGATGPVVARLAERLGGRAATLNVAVDGAFPAHHPDPAVAANLEQLGAAVRGGGFDLGVAFDGDGDRLGLVDAAGSVVWADETLLLLSADLLARHPGATVVADIKCSRRLFDGVAAMGGRAVAAPSGYALVRRAMRANRALLAGELSGHVFFDDISGDLSGVDDALHAAVRVFQALTRLGVSLRGFVQALPPSFLTPELRLPCAEARKRAVVAEVAARVPEEERSFDPAFGLKVVNADGWWLLRASATEPKISCRCEAGSAEGLARLRERLAGELRLSGVEGLA